MTVQEYMDLLKPAGEKIELIGGEVIHPEPGNPRNQQIERSAPAGIVALKKSWRQSVLLRDLSIERGQFGNA
jgi:hypothetical protein